MIRKRQFSFFSLLAAVFWLSVGMAIARYGLLSTSTWGIERRLLVVACFAWAGVGFAFTDKSHLGLEGAIIGAAIGAAGGICAQWQFAAEQ